MIQRGGGRRSKPRRGPLKADHNRPSKNIQQQTSDNPPTEDLRGYVGETKIEDKFHKNIRISETHKQDAQDDVRQKQLETATLDSCCNNRECVNIKTQYQKLLLEREHHIEIIKQLRKAQQLTSKDCQINAPPEIIEIDISAKHAVASKDTPVQVVGPNLDDAFDKSSGVEKNHEPRKKETKEDSRSQKDESLEQGKLKNWADRNVPEQEKHVDSAWSVHGAGIKESRNDSIDACTQQTTSWADEPEDETKNNRSLLQQEANQGDTAESFNIRYNCPEQNRNKKMQNVYPNARQRGGSNGSGSRDHKLSHYEERQQYEYGQWHSREGGNWRSNRVKQPVKPNRVLKETEGDLFSAPKTCSLAHCVAEDMRMGSGIAVTFRQRFKRIDQLLSQEKQTGEVAVLEDEGRFIYYLVTKRLSHNKPCLEHLRSSVKKMRQHMLENNVHDVAMPRIGCGLDRLNWWEVKSTLIEIFGDDDVMITVYNFKPDQGERNQQKSSLQITHAGYSLINIQHGTGLLYLGSEDGDISESLQSLLVKFPIIQQYKESKKCVGQFVRTECKNEVLYGLIIKKNGHDKFSFTTFFQCLKSVRNVILNDGYKYAGIDVVSIGHDPELDTEKLLTVFKNVWFNSHLSLYICWPEKYISFYKNCYEESQKLTKQ